PDPTAPDRIQPRTALSLHDLNDHLVRIHAREVVLIADCCYSGGMAPDWNTIGDELRAGWKSRYVMAAARGREPAYETGDRLLAQGFFTPPLCRALRGEAVPTDDRRRVSAQDAFNAAHKAMSEEVARYQLEGHKFEQVAVSAGAGALIYLTQAPLAPD